MRGWEAGAGVGTPSGEGGMFRAGGRAKWGMKATQLNKIKHI